MRRAPHGHRRSVVALVLATATVPASAAVGEWHLLGWPIALSSGFLSLVILVCAWFLNHLLKRHELTEVEIWRHAGLNDALLESSADGVAMCDLEGAIFMANPVFERLTSVIIGKPANLVASPRTMRETGALIAERITDPASYRAALAAADAAPERELIVQYEVAMSGRSFRRRIGPVWAPSGRLIGRILTLREITAEREAERLKSRLVATVSHELRTPLASIVGFAELLVDRDLDEETRTRYAKTIHGEAVRLSSLADNFLDLHRIEEGNLTMEPEAFDLSKLLREQAEVFSGQSRTHMIELDVPDEPLTVLGEHDRITQVASNLISNAIKYSPGGGTVHVRAERVRGGVRVSIRDHGLGIPEAQQGKVFQKFFRVDSSDTSAIGGTGLGLALCREIVRTHGGRIGFDSLIGEGTTFWFKLPGQRQEPQETPAVASLTA
jgi:signal transduction histidine kinase